MSDSMQQLFTDMASESTLELFGDLQQLRRFVEYATTHTIREVREWLTEHGDVITNNEESSDERMG